MLDKYLLILRVFFISFLLVIVSCKKKTKDSSIKQKNQSAIVKNRDSLPLKEVKKQSGIIYSYLDKETNDFQELIIYWTDKENFSFDIKMENDLCEYNDKGKASLKGDGSYIVEDHSTLKSIGFNDDKTIVQLICEYGEIRDECDPIAEFKMIKKKD